jgi:predicted MFS family arabinose efflux permease
MVPIRLFAPFAFGYFLSYLFRVVNAVAGPEISADFGIDPAALGFLTSVYFLTFAAIQLPLGVLLDRYGPHRVEAVLLVVAAAGAGLFALGDDLAALTVGRAMIGFGVSACLMAAFKAYAAAVPAERLPLVNGLHMAVGGLGVLAGGLPAEMAVNAFGWRGLFAALAALALVGSLALLVVVPASPRKPATETLGAQIRGVGRVLADPAFLRLAPLATAAQTTVFAVQSLWVGPWLRDVAGFSPTAAATTLSVMAAATICGYVASGVAANRLARRGVSVGTVSVAGTVAFILVQPAIILLPPAATLPLWLAFAFFGTVSTLAYPALTAAFPGSLAGRVNTALNFVVFVAAFLAQWAIGVVVARLGPQMGVEAAYDVAYWALVAAQVAALAWYLARRPAVRPAAA